MDVFVDCNRRLGADTGKIMKYKDIVRIKVDKHHNLRLFRKGRLFNRQDIFHPAGEWKAVGPAWEGFEHAPKSDYRPGGHGFLGLEPEHVGEQGEGPGPS